jgi:hypothetical protein
MIFLVRLAKATDLLGRWNFFNHKGKTKEGGH